MNPSEILGKALQSYYNGHVNAKIIVHSPEFDPDEQLASYYFRGFEQMPEIEKVALSLCSGSCLDIGAAAGCHSLELQNRNINVTAIELSSIACEIMRQRGVKNVQNKDVFDMSNGKYDTILMLMNGIGLVQSLEGLKKFLKHIKTYMNPDAQLIFDSANLIYLFQDEDSNEAVIDLNDNYYGEMEFEMEFDGFKSIPFTWLYVDFDTLCYYAEEEGFMPELITQDDNFQYLARLLLVK